MISRSEKWNLLSATTFDVAIVGGGINGAVVYHRLCSEGYRVLLIDQCDFSSGTSQASAMMAWGGLLYLSTLDFASVWQLSASRDRLIDRLSASVTPRSFRYVSKQSKHTVLAALYFYWLLGLGRRRMPYKDRCFPESKFLQEEFSSDSLVYEEACLQPSDARFVLSWIIANQNEFHVPINYCGLQHCQYDPSHQLWKLELKDTLTGKESSTQAKLIVNAAGVWADGLNERAGIETQYKHIFGKGVFLGFQRFEGHEMPLIVDSGKHKQSLCLIPWGPISLWGPTETKLDSLESAFQADPEDIKFLLERLNQHRKHPVHKSGIVSLRCGVRPLVVERTYDCSEPTLEISRRHRVIEDSDLPWITLYGGKITSCVALAEETLLEVQKRFKPSGQVMQQESHPDEMCCTLEDYVRRRTNISQWTPRGGFGFHNEHRSALLSIAIQIHHDPKKAETDLNRYEKKIQREFDSVIREVA